MDKVVHFEIPADNIERAKKFYQTLFGWKINDVPNMNYSIIHTVEVDERNMPKEPGAINGGMYKRESADSPVVVIDVKSVDDSLKKIKKAGGSVVTPKQTIQDMGYYAKVKDTEGNVIGIFQVIPRSEAQ